MHTTEITTQNFSDSINREGIVFVDWWAPWCGPCRMFAPIFEAAAARHPGITWGKVNTESQRELAAAANIRSIPTLMVFRDGILLFEQPGMMPGTALDQLVQQVQALDMKEIQRRVEADERAGAPSAA